MFYQTYYYLIYKLYNHYYITLRLNTTALHFALHSILVGMGLLMPGNKNEKLNYIIKWTIINCFNCFIVSPLALKYTTFIYTKCTAPTHTRHKILKFQM